MELNLEFYKNDLFYRKMNDEEKIIKYINENSEKDYKNIINEDSTEEVITTLSDLRKNIIYTYDFNPNCTILEIGAHFGEITGGLCEKASKVVSVDFNKKSGDVIAKRHEDKKNLEIIIGNLEDIKFEEKFDYVVLCGIIEYAQKIYNTENPVKSLISFCKTVLKDNGKILIATDNKFAMKSYVGNIEECTDITFDSITGYKSSPKSYKLGKIELEKILQEEGFSYNKFLYPLPDYKLANSVFSDDYLPSSSKINAYFPYYKDNSYVFYSEVDAYDTIIKEDKRIFPLVANSFFIEASMTETKNDIKYISFNNYRKSKYQLMTKIRENIVEKVPINIESREHIKDMAYNIEDLKNNKNVEILDYYENDKIVSNFVKNKLASQIISDNKDNCEKIIRILKEYKEIIDKNAIDYKEGMNTAFDKYSINIEENTKKELHYLENGYWDMILKNCFIVDEKYIFFDQEWKEENIPAEFLLYRSISNIEKIRDKIEEYDLYEKMQIKKYILIFEELDRKITEEIIDKTMLQFYLRRYKNPIYDSIDKEEYRKILNQKQELEKLKVKDDEKIEELQNKVEKLKNDLNSIYQLKSWKFISRILKKKNKLKG